MFESWMQRISALSLFYLLAACGGGKIETMDTTYRNTSVVKSGSSAVVNEVQKRTKPLLTVPP